MIKIGIVDDELIFRTYLKTTLDWQAYGFDLCLEAKNGIDALKRMEEILPDILLCDINMPFMNGIELSAAIKEKYPQMVIILLTGYNEFEYARNALRIGVNDYIWKPFDKKELLTTLNEIKKKVLLQRQAYSEEERD